MPVDDNARSIVADWVSELTRDHLWGPADPLFPKTQTGLAADGRFAPVGILREGWASGDRARDIIQGAFSAVGLPKFHPHSIRHALIRHATTLDLTPEEMKAWSQNLGHTDVLTTFLSYGQVPTHRQGELSTQRPRLEPTLARSMIAHCWKRLPRDSAAKASYLRRPRLILPLKDEFDLSSVPLAAARSSDAAGVQCRRDLPQTSPFVSGGNRFDLATNL